MNDHRFTDVCRIERRAGGAFDTITGGYGAGTATTIYQGPCLEESLSASGGFRRQLGEEAVTLRGHYVFLPEGAVGIDVEDVVVLTASLDAGKVGREMVIRDVGSSAASSGAIVRWVIAEDSEEGP